jgi:DNA-binding CsgD family transcriptional regulator
LYDLTPAETRIVGYLVDGLNMSEIAVRLGVAPSTVKTHVLRIYEKTGTHRQAELAALMRSISVPW